MNGTSSGTFVLRVTVWWLLVIAAALFAPLGVLQAQTAAPETPEPTATGILDPLISATRAPVPTVTPSVIEQEVADLAAQVGLETARFLGLGATDWINLAISLLFVVAGYLLGTWLIRRLMPRLAARTGPEIDDALVEAVGPGLRWLVVVIVLRPATSRLLFVSATIKAILADLYFVLGLALAALVVWRLIGVADQWYRDRFALKGRAGEMGPIITLLSRATRVIAIIVLLLIFLSHFGINVSAFVAALGIGGLAFSLAARDTIADAIAGFIILVDQPFRIGDRIEIQEASTWGDVVDIGLRTTRIRTRDNRMVIVPNSIIGSNQVINYSYPDPRYRIETHVGIAYDTDVERARQVLVDAVKEVQGVLLDKPVDALYIEMGESAMIFRVRWWIESYIDTRRMFDKMHTALQHALDEAGIESPYPIRTVELRTSGAAAAAVSDAPPHATGA